MSRETPYVPTPGLEHTNSQHIASYGRGDYKRGLGLGRATAVPTSSKSPALLLGGAPVTEATEERALEVACRGQDGSPESADVVAAAF